MKKLLIIPLLAFLTSCGCLLSQVPPQTIYVDQNCQVVLPDFRPKVIVSDNCAEGVILTQTPIPGTIIGANTPEMSVWISGVDQSGNKSNTLEIPIILLDTIAPILSWPIGQITMGEEKLIDVYKLWESQVKVYGIAQWIYDQNWTQGMPFADTTAIMAGLYRFTHDIVLTEEEYQQYKALKESK